MPGDQERWPKTLQRFLYDFMPASKAPKDDGIVPPNPEIPDWVAHVSGIPESLDVARRARESAEESAKTAEDKASRLLQVNLALLTIALALGSYQLEFALNRSATWLVSLIPIGTALVCLALSAFESTQIDRVGIYSHPDGSELASVEKDGVRRALLESEVRGRMLAGWSSRKKLTDLMQARAWFTRGLAALLIAGLIAGVARAESNAAPSRIPTPVVNDHPGFQQPPPARSPFAPTWRHPSWRGR
jgi:hypothetical protein